MVFGPVVSYEQQQRSSCLPTSFDIGSVQENTRRPNEKCSRPRRARHPSSDPFSRSTGGGTIFFQDSKSRGRRVLTRQPLPVASLPYWWTRYISLGGAATGPSPVDRAKTGSKHHILTCSNGFPLAVALSGADVNDHLLLPTLLDRVRPLRGRAGRPRHRITTLIADKGYDYPSVYSPTAATTYHRLHRAPRHPRQGHHRPLDRRTILRPVPGTGGWPSDGNDAPTSTTGSSTSLQP
ncbi:transposase [Nocardia sp. NPDC004711]